MVCFSSKWNLKGECNISLMTHSERKLVSGAEMKDSHWTKLGVGIKGSFDGVLVDHRLQCGVHEVDWTKFSRLIGQPMIKSFKV